ncbi:binding-protein-dependent maltose/mannitol transport protein [Pseudomonas aeruginosa]|nr:binding-protein-dependent maltose/mannitol transport protein [Pseudomonas aeruginosa]
MLLTSFKSEIDAFATPPQFIFQPTLENYLHINERSDYFAYAWNSLLISSSATLLCMLVAVPAALLHGLLETRHTKRTLLWMLSTKMLPAGRRTDADLPAGQAVRPARFAAGADHRLHP